MVRQGLPLVIVQPGLVYGPGDKSSVRETMVQYLKRKLPLVPRKTAFNWAHVEDTALGHVLAMERGKPGASYIIAGSAHTLEEALDLAQAITGIPAPQFRAPGLDERVGCTDGCRWFPHFPTSFVHGRGSARVRRFNLPGR